MSQDAVKMRTLKLEDWMVRNTISFLLFDLTLWIDVCVCLTDSDTFRGTTKSASVRTPTKHQHKLDEMGCTFAMPGNYDFDDTLYVLIIGCVSH